jgi:hypothetical protein
MANLFDVGKKRAFGCKIELVLICSLLIDEKGDCYEETDSLYG